MDIHAVLLLKETRFGSNWDPSCRPESKRAKATCHWQHCSQTAIKPRVGRMGLEMRHAPSISLQFQGQIWWLSITFFLGTIFFLDSRSVSLCWKKQMLVNPQYLLIKPQVCWQSLPMIIFFWQICSVFVEVWILSLNPMFFLLSLMFLLETMRCLLGKCLFFLVKINLGCFRCVYIYISNYIFVDPPFASFK